MGIPNDYTVDIDLNLRSKQAFDRMNKEYGAIKKKIENDIIQTRITADYKDIEQVMKDISKLTPDQLSDTLFKVGGGTLGKQLNQLVSYVGQSGKDIGNNFRKNIQEGLQGSFMDLGDLVQKYLGEGKRATGGNIKNVLDMMKNELSSPIDDSNYLEIVQRAEKLEQLWYTISQIKKEKPKIYENLGTDKNELSKYIADQYSQIGNIFSNKQNIDMFVGQINNVFDTVRQNLENTFSNLLKIRGTGTGTGTGTGDGSGDGKGDGSSAGTGGTTGTGGFNANEEEIKRINNEIKELSTQIDEAQSKLEELKKGTKITDSLDKNTKSKLLDAIKIDIQTITEELSSMGDKIPIDKAQKFMDLLTTYYELGGEEIKIADSESMRNKIADMETHLYEKFDPDEEGEFGGQVLKKYINTQAIEEQMAIVQGLTDKLRELQETKERLSSSGAGGTGTGGEGAKVPVEPDATGFIGKVQQQIDAGGETVKVKIDIDVGDNTLDNIKDKLDAIPEKKEIKFSIVDYDNIPLLSDAAGNVQDVFRGTHGVFGNWGMDGVSWFTDELQLASQYADNLAEDGKIIRANLSFKNPLEIFGNGADFDKIDISDAAQSVKDMAAKMGFDIKKMLTDDIVQVAKATGYDGVIFRDIKDGYDDLAHNVFAVVDSIQAKNEELYASVYKQTGEIVKLEDNGVPASNIPVNAEFKPIVAGIRPAIEEELANPFDVKLNPDTANLRSDIEGELQSEPFYIQVANTGELRDMIDMELSNPFEINIQPNNSLIDAINDMLKQNQFNIDVGVGNVGGGHSNAQDPYQIIYDMMQADKTMQEELIGDDPKLGPLKERTMFFDSKTGQHTNPYVFDRHGSSRWAIVAPKDENGFYKKGVYDTGMHSHPEKFAHMSIGESGDLIAFFSQMENLGVSKQIIAGRNDVQIFDAQAFYNDLNKMIGGDLDIFILKEIGKEVNNVSQSTDDLFINSTNRVVEFLNYVRKFEDYNFDTSSLIKNLDNADYNGGVTVSKAAKSVLRSKEFTNNFLDFVNSDPAYMFNSLEESMEDFLRSRIFEELPDSFKHKNGTYGAINEALSAIFGDFNRQPGSFYFDNFVGKGNINGADDRYWDIIHRYATNRVWKDLEFTDPYTGEIKNLFIDWEKYNTYMPMEDFRKKFAGAITPSGGVDMSQVAGQPVNADINFDGASTKLQEAITNGGPYKVDVEPDQNNLSTKVAEAIGYGEPYYITSMEVDAGVDLGQQIKDKIDSGKPYLINPELDPSSTLVQNIQDALQNAKLTVSVDGNLNNNVESGSQGSNLSDGNKQNIEQQAESDANAYITAYRKFFKSNGLMNTRNNVAWLSSTDQTIGGYYGDTIAQTKVDISKLLQVDANGSLWDQIVFDGKRVDTDWIADYAKQLGYLGVVIKNVKDNATGDNGIIQDTIAIFDSKLIKEVEQIKGDDKPIVLEKKFKVMPSFEWQNKDRDSQLKNSIDSYTTEEQQFAKDIYDGKYFNTTIRGLNNNIFSQLESGAISLKDAYIELDRVAQNAIIIPRYAEIELLGASLEDFSEEAQKFYNDTFDIAQGKVQPIIEQLESGSISMKEAYDKLGILDRYSDKTSNLIPQQKTDATTTSSATSAVTFQQEQQAVEQAVSAEEAAFDKLKTKLVQEIPEAVDHKTQAFRSEQVEVDNLIDLEISKLQELANTLQNAFKVDDTSNLEPLKALLESISSFGNDQSSLNFDELSKGITELSNALSQLQGVDSGSKLAEILANMKFTKANIDNLVNLATAIEMLAESFKKLNGDMSGSSAFGSINEMLKNAEALQNLAKILSASSKERQNAATQAGLNTDKNIEKANAAAEKQFDNLTKYYELQDQLNLERISGTSGKRSIKDSGNEEKLLRAINEYEESINKKREAGLALTEKEEAVLAKRQELIKEVAKREAEYQEAQAKSDEQSKKTRIEVMQESRENIGKSIEEFASNTNFLGGEFDNIVAELKSKFVELQSIDLVDDEDLTKAEQLEKEIWNIIREANKNPDLLKAKETSRTGLQAKAGKWLGKNTAAPDDLRQQVAMLYNELSSDVPVSRLKEIAAELNRVEAEAAKAGQTGKSFGDKLKGSFGNLARYLASFASFYRIIGVIRNAINTVKELDTALMEVRKVSDESLSSLHNWQKLTFDQADAVGGSAKQIQESTAAWLRLGKSFTESQEAAQASVKLLNVSEFTSIDDATTSLVSMRQAFRDLSYEDFIDKLNGVGDHFSSSTDQLAQGMRNVSSVLKVAGNDIDQSLALLTAAKSLAVKYGNIF